MSLQKRKLLHEAEYFPHYYLCTYIPKAAGSDRLSQSLLHFKNGTSPHLQAWTECAVEELQSVRELREAYVIRAFGHDELVHNSGRNESLARLTVKICNAIQGTYVPNFLEKTRNTKKLAYLSKAEREDEVYRVYRFTSPDRDPKQVLIIDDILTSGATIRSIIAAVLSATPSVKISVFTLAYTAQHGVDNSDVSLKGKSYQWQPNDGWMVAAEGSPEYAATHARIKHLIIHDLFI